MRNLRLHINDRWQARARSLFTANPAVRVSSLSLANASVQNCFLCQRAGNKTTCNSQALRGDNIARSRSLQAIDPRPFVRAPFQKPQGAIQGRASYSNRATISQEPTIHSVFEKVTGTWQYVVADPSTLNTVTIDPVLDYDPATQVVATRAADSLLSLIKEKRYKVDGILETHAHADYLTASSYLQNHLVRSQSYRPPICIGKRITTVQRLFGKVYEIPANEYKGVFDKLLDDDETFNIGNLQATAIHLPGHTPDHLGYKIGDNVFCGDSIFHADIGTAHCNFPSGNASDLFNSGRKLLGMPEHVKI